MTGPKTHKRWDEEDSEFLKRNYQSMSDREISKLLGRTRQSIKAKRKKMDLMKGSGNRVVWTDEMIEYLKNNYKEDSDKEIAVDLGVTKKKVSRKRRGLNLYKEGSQDWWTDSEVEYLKKNWKNKSDKEISKHINRSRKSVKNKRHRMGLMKDGNKVSKQKAVSNGAKRKNGTIKEGKDYKTIKVNGDIRKLHRYKMEQKIKRDLDEEEIVHHINGDKSDNRIENLHLCKNNTHHFELHHDLQHKAQKLVQMGVIEFDKKKEEYQINYSKLKQERLIK